MQQECITDKVYCGCVLPGKSTTINNTEFNESKKAICLRKSEVSVDRISVRNIIEYLAEHGMHCLPYSHTNDVIDMLPLQPVCHSIVAIVTDLLCHLTYNARGMWHAS